MTSQRDSVLAFVFNHQIVIIEGLFAIILGIVVLWLFTHLKQESESESSSGGLREIEAVLKRVLETSGAKSVAGAASAPAVSVPPSGVGVTPVSATTVAPAPVAAAPKMTPLTPVAPAAAAAAPSAPVTNAASNGAVSTDEMARLKRELDAKTQQLAELEKAFGQVQADLKKVQDALNAAAQTPSAQTDAEASAALNALQEKLSNLEARLREYEIIEDDIANLTTYKTENAKLKEVVDRLRAQLDALHEKNGSKSHESGGTVTPQPVPVESELSKVLSAGTQVANADATVAQLIEEQGSKEGEKLISEFQNFMKGSS